MVTIFRDKKKEKDEQEVKRNELLVELKEAKDAMNAVYQNLSYVVDNDMIDCCIYELNALQLRYKIILNQVKDQEARA